MRVLLQDSELKQVEAGVEAEVEPQARVILQKWTSFR